MKPQFAKTAAELGAALLLSFLSLPDTDAVAQIRLPPVTDPLDPMLDPTLDRTRDGLDSRIRRRQKESKETLEETAGTVVEAGENAVDETLSVAGEVAATAGGAVNTVLRSFIAGTDSNGWIIERGMLVLLLDDQQLALLAHGNFDIVAQRKLTSLGLTIVSLRDSGRATLDQALGDLRAALPDAAVDFNHIYSFASANEAATQVSGNEAAGNPLADQSLRIGLIDSAVDPKHFSLRDSHVTGEDFVTLDGERPLGHGTAVASIIAANANNKALIYSASVFFQAHNHAPGASTDSLVAALDWLAGEKVDVVNMSLSGPPNALLERALSSLAKSGLLVVAAVGNNGPSGEPLYPAAYESVIGVTAIDRDKKIFRYANRGPHVDFAALGVNVKVADAGRSWRLESGTSMASPVVAVLIARARNASDLPNKALLEIIVANSEDLGRRGFDPVFGHGLIVQPPVMLSGTQDENPQ